MFWTGSCKAPKSAKDIGTRIVCFSVVFKQIALLVDNVLEILQNITPPKLYVIPSLKKIIEAKTFQWRVSVMTFTFTDFPTSIINLLNF